MLSSATDFVLLGSSGAAALGVVHLRLRDQTTRDASRSTWEVRWPRDVEPAALLSWLRLVSGTPARPSLLGHDSVSLEVRAAPDSIRHLLRLPAEADETLARQLRAAAPGAWVSKIEPPELGADLVRELHLSGRGTLRTTDPAGLSRGLLSVAGQLGADEELVWQWVIRPTRQDAVEAGSSDPRATSWRWILSALVQGKPSPGRTRESDRTTSRKLDEPLFVAIGRIGVAAASPERRRQLLDRLAQIAGSVAMPGVRLTPRATSGALPRLRTARTPLFSAPAVLNADEIVTLSGVPFGGPLLPGMRYARGKLILPTPEVPRTGLVLGDANAVANRPVAVAFQAAPEHGLVLGPTGSGKTYELVQLILQALANGSGGLVIDPQNGLIDLLLDQIDPTLAHLIVVIDPLAQRVVPVPLLESGSDPMLGVIALYEYLVQRYRELGARSADLLLNSFATLARQPTPAGLLEVFALWNDPSYRAEAVAHVTDDPVLQQFWASFNEFSPDEIAAITLAPANKLRPLILDQRLRPVVATPRSTVDFREAIAKGYLVLARLGEGQLGRTPVDLLGNVLLSRAWQAIRSGAAKAGKLDRQFFIVVDEAPRFVDIGVKLDEMLAMGRQWGASIWLAAQTLSQFPPHLRSVVTANTRTQVIFGTSADDAHTLAREFAPFVTAEDILAIPRFNAIARVSLRGSTSQPFTMSTRALPPPRGTADLIREASAQRWGLDRDALTQELAARLAPKQRGPIGKRRHP